MIKKGLADRHVIAATKLSLTQRARRILQSKVVIKRKKKRASEAAADETEGSSLDTGVGSYSLNDFPEEDLVPAPEVGKALQLSTKCS